MPGMRAKYKKSMTSLMNGGLGSEAKSRLPSLREAKLKMLGAKDEEKPAAAVAQAAKQPADVAIGLWGGTTR